MVRLLPRPYTVAALLLGEGEGQWKTIKHVDQALQLRRCGPRWATIRVRELFVYSQCQPHILPLIPALASHREESPQRRKENREFKNSR